MKFLHETGYIALYDEEGHIAGKVTCFPNKSGTVVIDHTFVNAEYRGRGIAGQLMMELVKHLRQRGQQVILECDYAVKWFQKHPEYSDLVKEAD